MLTFLEDRSDRGSSHFVRTDDQCYKTTLVAHFNDDRRGELNAVRTTRCFLDTEIPLTSGGGSVLQPRLFN